MGWGKLFSVSVLGTAGLLVFAPWISPPLAHLASLRGSNPPVTGDITAPPDVATMLRQSCYDCHSNETRWPWYSSVAPISWIIAHDVERGRQEVNFSEWTTYLPATRKRKLQWIERTLHEQVMPLRLYCILHPDAWLTEQETTLLEHWLQAQLTELQQTSQSQESR